MLLLRLFVLAFLLSSCYNVHVAPPIEVNAFDGAHQGRIGFSYATSGIASGHAAFSITDHYAINASASFAPSKNTATYRDDSRALELSLERFSASEEAEWSLILGGGLSRSSITDSGSVNAFSDGGYRAFHGYEANYLKIFAGIQDGFRGETYEAGGGVQVFYLDYYRFQEISYNLDTASKQISLDLVSIRSPQRSFGGEPFIYYRIKAELTGGVKVGILTELALPWVPNSSMIPQAPFISLGLHILF